MPIVMGANAPFSFLFFPKHLNQMFSFYSIFSLMVFLFSF